MDGPGNGDSHRQEAKAPVCFSGGKVHKIAVIKYPPPKGTGLVGAGKQPQAHPQRQLPAARGVGIPGQGEAAARHHQKALHLPGGAPVLPASAEADGAYRHPAPGKGRRGVVPAAIPAGMQQRQRLPRQESRLLQEVIVAVPRNPADGQVRR